MRVIATDRAPGPHQFQLAEIAAIVLLLAIGQMLVRKDEDDVVEPRPMDLAERLPVERLAQIDACNGGAQRL